MALTNRDRVGKAIDLLAAGLQPFVERELKAALGDQWRTALEDASGRRIQNPKSKIPTWPIHRSCSAPFGTSGTTSSPERLGRPCGVSSASCATCGPVGRTTKPLAAT